MRPVDLALHVVALLVYPGALLALAIGLPAEVAAARALQGGRSAREVATAVLAGARRPAVLAAAALGALAATQLAIPFNAVSPVERNLLVAAVALACATWLGRDPYSESGSRLAVLTQMCWLVAVFAPALLSQSLRPQALGAVVVPAQLPLKVGCALLYLLCLPGLLQLGAPSAPVRVPLWLPFCGLGASLFIPAGADDAIGVLAFLVATLGAAAAAIGLARMARRRPERAARLMYLRLAPLLAGLVLAIAVATAILT